MSKIRQLKSELKQEAILIRKAKAAHREAQRSDNPWKTFSEWSKQNPGTDWPMWMSSRYRYRHIAYCMLRGKTYEQIEPKVREGNAVYMNRIEEIMREYRDVEEIRCAEVVNV